jgi:F-type H+-transporting ATPase subunit delta
MAELATIARPYAEALFKASSSDLAGTSRLARKAGRHRGNPQLQQFADNPKVTDPQVFDVVAGCCVRRCPPPPRTSCAR